MPDTAPMLTTSQVANRLSIKPSTWRKYVSLSRAPKADGYHDRRTPYWFKSTIDKYAIERGYEQEEQ